MFKNDNKKRFSLRTVHSQKVTIYEKQGCYACTHSVRNRVCTCDVCVKHFDVFMADVETPFITIASAKLPIMLHKPNQKLLCPRNTYQIYLNNESLYKIKNFGISLLIKNYKP